MTIVHTFFSGAWVVDLFEYRFSIQSMVLRVGWIGEMRGTALGRRKRDDIPFLSFFLSPMCC